MIRKDLASRPHGPSVRRNTLPTFVRPTVHPLRICVPGLLEL